jgi:hypothetical protein
MHRSLSISFLLPLCLTVSAVSLTASAQVERTERVPFASSDAADPGGTATASTRPAEQTRPSASPGYAPFSRAALGVSVSPLGVGIEATTNFNSHINFRSNGSYFQYTANNIQTQGFNVTANIKLSSARASIDFYPFHAGFRLSPGLMFYNGNHATATVGVPGGTSFSLDNNTFYSASGTNAVSGRGTFGLGNGHPAFTMTTGWGNAIPRRGHLSFPVEIGAAFIHQPTVNAALSGYVCDQNGQNCVSAASNSYVQEALSAQLQKYQNDVNPLKTFPIVSFGVAYNFRTRSVNRY